MRKRLRLTLILILALLAGVIWLMLAEKKVPTSSESRLPVSQPSSRGPTQPRNQTAEPPSELPTAPADREPPASLAANPNAPSAVHQLGGASIREVRAYRLVLNGPACRLDAIEELRGDFKKARLMQRQAGMICCRLLDGAGRLLAEETLPAPDQVCVVLDPNVPSADGKPTPAMLATGGETVFQTRLPKVKGAVTLEVLRLSGGDPAAPHERPPGQLLAVIALPES